MSTKAVSATGWIADNWPAFASEAQPPVILNPEASTGAVLAWCYGELRSLHATSMALSDELSADEVMVIFAHRLGPAVAVMRAAIEQMAAAECRAANEAKGGAS